METSRKSCLTSIVVYSLYTLLIAACGTSTDQTIAEETFQLAQMKQQIESLAQYQTCFKNSDCGVQQLGMTPCGPDDEVVVSNASSNGGALMALVTQYNQLSQQLFSLQSGDNSSSANNSAAPGSSGTGGASPNSATCTPLPPMTATCGTPSASGGTSSASGGTSSASGNSASVCQMAPLVSQY